MSRGMRTEKIKNETDHKGWRPQACLLSNTNSLVWCFWEWCKTQGNLCPFLTLEFPCTKRHRGRAASLDGCQHCEYGLLKITRCQEDAKGDNLKRKMPSEDPAQVQKRLQRQWERNVRISSESQATIPKQLLQFLERISLVTAIPGACRQIYLKFVLSFSEWLRNWRGVAWFADVPVTRR